MRGREWQQVMKRILHCCPVATPCILTSSTYPGMLHKAVHHSLLASPSITWLPPRQFSISSSYQSAQHVGQCGRHPAVALTRSVVSAGVSAPQGTTPSTATLPGMETYDSQWINHWKEGVDPGTRWDAGKCSPILNKLLADKQLDVTNKRVLVPGCGRGYDVFCFAQAGAAAAVGLDLSQEAVTEAGAERDRVLSQHLEAAARAEVAAANFFTYQHSSGQRFDIGYDYTFLCALHPDMRHDWAQAWSRLLAPGGELITLMFPVGPGYVGNPPWQVSPELYQELLLPAGFEQVMLEPVPAELSHNGRGGREWLGRWRRAGSSSSRSNSAADGVRDAGLRHDGNNHSRM